MYEVARGAFYPSHGAHGIDTNTSAKIMSKLKENATVFPYSNMFFPQLRRVDMYLSSLSPCT